MLNLPTKLLRTALLGIVLIFVTATIAVETDKEQPVEWSSDGDSTMKLEGSSRFLEMSDNVKVTQGSLEIFGDNALFEYSADSNDLQRVTVQGTPVRYQQLLDEEGSTVVGTSDTIVFYRDELADEMIVELIGNANIESPDSTMNCAAITYIADNDLIREATGPCQGSLNSNSN